MEKKKRKTRIAEGGGGKREGGVIERKNASPSAGN